MLKMNIEINNLTSECFINHKKDKIYKKYNSFDSIISVFLTKSYRIIRIDNFNVSIIIEVIQFCELLLKSYFKHKIVYFNKNKIKFCINHNLRTFELEENQKNVLKLNYSKCKLILKDLMDVYKSTILNSKNFMHIENKKKEIETIIKKIKILKLNSTILNDFCLNKRFITDNSNIIYDKFICKKLLIFYFMSKF
jgi:hypothetical protein